MKEISQLRHPRLLHGFPSCPAFPISCADFTIVTDHLPTATLETLQRRAELLRETRRFFDTAGYFEVDTPLLSADIVVDAWIEPFVAFWRPDPFSTDPARGERRYLQTSPEFAMKRLLAAGATAIYQLGKVFRNGEVGHRHNPEFTMLEWYRVHDDLEAQMQVTEDYLAHLLAYVADARHQWPQELRTRAVGWLNRFPMEHCSYEDAFLRHTGVTVLSAPMSALHELARSQRLEPPPSLAVDDRDGWLNWLLAELVEPHLGKKRPTFLFDYPATQAALAQTRLREDGIAVARRFELYVDGVEFCNGYHELTQSDELRRRNAAQAEVRAAAGLMPLPVESRLLAAMDAGLPDSAGVALGFDRVVQLLLAQPTIADVLPFAFPRA